jgi:hypothetical protein
MPTGSLPAEGKKVYEAVLKECKSKGMSDEEAAKRAWGAVHNAGWHKKGDSWMKAEHVLYSFGELAPFQKVGLDLFRKMALPIGEWVYDGKPLVVTKDRIQKIIDNFNAGNPGKVPVPVGHEGFQNALANTGFVRGIEFDPTPVETATAKYPEGGAYVYIDFTNPEASKLAGQGTIPDVSVSLVDGWEHPETGKVVDGEVLEHVCITSNPFVQGMPGFEAVRAELDKNGMAIGHIIRLEAPIQGNARKEGDTTMSADVTRLEALLKESQETAKKNQEAADAKLVELETKVTAKITELEKQREAERKELEEQRATANRMYAARIETELDALIGGKVPGAKYGLPAAIKPVALAILVNHGSTTVKLERGTKYKPETVEAPLGTTLMTLLEGIVKMGLPSRQTILARVDETPQGGGRINLGKRYKDRHGTMAVDGKPGEQDKDDK